MKYKKCFHCGKKINKKKIIIFKKKLFCCYECKEVYNIIISKKLKIFYKLNNNPGISPKKNKKYKFQFLDNSKIKKNIVSYEDEKITVVRFIIPSIYCTSCILLLESIPKINKKIIQSNVDFTQKIIQIKFKNKEYKLSDVANFLTKLGYKPCLNFQFFEKKKKKNLKFLYKIAVSFFCFVNIMLLSFPQYIIGFNKDIWIENNKFFLSCIIFFLTLPVVFFSSSDYFISAYKGIKNKIINVNIPISLGILVIFFRSIYEIFFTKKGLGYFDSLCGLVFFLLIGHYFKIRTYHFLSFNKNYKSFYPIYVTKINSGIEKNIIISKLKKGDNILIRNEETIPVDSILIDEKTMIDTSFITGESFLTFKKKGDIIYAGSKQVGKAIRIKVIKKIDQSYLSTLWKSISNNKNSFLYKDLLTKYSHYFTLIILIICIISSIYWYFIDFSKILEVISSILIIACPCALSLSTPFTLGNVMRILANNGFFVKSYDIIERIAKINFLVFDKTGTISYNKKDKISFFGKKIKKDEKKKISFLLKNSNHILSKILYNYLSCSYNNINYLIKNFKEIPGKGLQGVVDDVPIKIGSESYLGFYKKKKKKNGTKVFISIKNEILGYFLLKNKFHKNLKNIFKKLKEYNISIISGDNDYDKFYLKSILPKKSKLFFYKTPKEKFFYIKKLQKKGKKVMMFGDGINDIIALKKSNVSVAVSNNNNNFLPSCDVLMEFKKFNLLPFFLKISKFSIIIIIVSFIISFIYNIIGITFAIKGNLNPIISAILMPLSSISVILFTTLSTFLFYFKMKNSSIFLNDKKKI